MKNIDALFADYAAYHRNAANKVCHRIGIPMIVFSLLGMLSHLVFLREPFRLDAAIVLIVVAQIVYFRLHVALAFAMLVPILAMYAGSLFVPLTVHIGLFVAGWVFQFYGHAVHEKRNPAFATNLIHLLIGPLWVLNDVVRIVRPQATAT